MTAMYRRSDCHDDAKAGGFIVVAVLWILLALATLTAVYSVYVANSAIAQSVTEDRLHTEALITAGLELAAYRLSVPKTAQQGQAPGQGQAPQIPGQGQAARRQGQAPGASAAPLRPTRGSFSFRLRGGSVAVDYISEAARIDLNAASKDMLTGLFVVLGAEGDAASQYADRVIGWRSKLKPDQQVNEDAIYRAAGLRYGPRGGPFAHVNELWMVAGLPSGLVARAMPLVTIYSGRPDVNLMEASADVLAALPGMTAARLNAFLSQRERLPPDPQLITAALGTQPGAGTAASEAYRVRIRVTLDKGLRTEVEAVILLGHSDGPYGILSWQSDADVLPGATSTVVAP